MHRSIIAAGLLLAATATPAQTVYRCVEKGKPVSFQNAPCGPSARATTATAYTPDPPPTAAQVARLEAMRREVERRRARRPSRVYAAPAAPDGGSYCANVKADRDRWERAAGLSRTYDQLASWNERVRQACR